jgi:SAM-dependent methyltransferase
MNEEQKAYWNEVAGPRWVAADDVVARIEEPLLERLVAAASPSPGEAALDVGCGSGRSTVLLARAVGPEGRVVGLDLSRPLLELARARLEREGCGGWTELVEGDAQVHRFAEAFDLVLSIFGVMFFESPEAAFANLRRALRPAGRLVFLCWQAPHRNPWVMLPVGAARAHLELPAPVPGAPGPFALADPERVRGLLESAGFVDVTLTSCEEQLDVAPSVEAALEFMLRVGPLASPLAQAEPAARLRALAAIREALAEQAGDGPVRLGGATWLVHARPG